jgi:hypothetical protein
MNDVLFLALVALLFAALWAIVKLCEWVRPR